MFRLTIKTENAAFEDAHEEVARILREAATAIERGTSEGRLRDINGNPVGSYALTGKAAR